MIRVVVVVVGWYTVLSSLQDWPLFSLFSFLCYDIVDVLCIKNDLMYDERCVKFLKLTCLA